MKARPGSYGMKEACRGSWQWPVNGSTYIKPEVKAYYDRIRGRSRVRMWAGHRGQCATCGKDCSIRSDGTVGSHVNTKLARQRKRDEVKTAIATAKTDLLALRNELLSEENT